MNIRRTTEAIGYLFNAQHGQFSFIEHLAKGPPQPGHAGSLDVTFGVGDHPTHDDSQSSFMAANLGKGIFEDTNGKIGGSGTDRESDRLWGDAVVEGHDVSHPAVARSSIMAGQTANNTHQDNPHSAHAAGFDADAFSTSSSGAGGGSLGGSSAVASSHDHGSPGQNAAQTSLDTKIVETVGFSHQDATGSSSLSFELNHTVHVNAYNSASSAAFVNGDQTGPGAGLLTFTQNSEWDLDSRTVEAFSFSEHGAGGSTSLSFKIESTSHQTTHSSATLAILDGGFASTGVGQADTGNEGHGVARFPAAMFSSKDATTDASSHMRETLSFSHQDASGVSRSAFDSETTTNHSSHDSLTLASFSDGEVGLIDALLHTGSFSGLLA